MLSVVGKIYAGILVDRVRTMTEGLIDDEQGGFRPGRECVDQIFTIKQICEKAWEKKCRVHVGFLDLEKAYDRVNREALWQVLRVYDVGGNLLNGIKSMYVNSVPCVRIKGGESECFRINSGVRQGCIMSPLTLQCIYGRSDENGRGREESGDCLASCMQMTWFCVVSRRKT